MNDTIDNLSDTELSEHFAVEIVGSLKCEIPLHGGLRAYSVVRTGAWREIRKEEFYDWPEDFVAYATDLDQVLPWLERWHDQDPQRRDVRMYRHFTRDWAVALMTRAEPWDDWVETIDVDESLSRAICLALLRAKRA